MNVSSHRTAVPFPMALKSQTCPVRYMWTGDAPQIHINAIKVKCFDPSIHALHKISGVLAMGSGCIGRYKGGNQECDAMGLVVSLVCSMLGIRKACPCVGICPAIGPSHRGMIRSRC